MNSSVEKMKKSYEGPSEWKLRKLFLLKNHGSGFSSDRLECLANCFVYEVLYGVSYPQPVMDEVKKMSDGIVNEVFPKGLPSYRGPSTSNNEKEEIPTKIAKPDKAVAKNETPLKEVAKKYVAKLPSLDTCDRQWMTVKNYETMVRVAGPRFRPIHFVKASAEGAEVADDNDQSLCFPSLNSSESMLNFNPRENSQSSANEKDQSAKRQQQAMDARATSPPASSTVTQIVITLQRLLETWLFMSEKSPQVGCVGTLINAASKCQIPLKLAVERRNSQIGLVGFACTVNVTDPSTGATVILSDGCARAKKEAKHLACFTLLKFRERPVKVNDLEPDSSGENCYRLIHANKTTAPTNKGDKVHGVFTSRPVAPLSNPVSQGAPQGAPQNAPQCTPQNAVQGTQQDAPQNTSQGAPQSSLHGAAQVIPQSAPRTSGQDIPQCAPQTSGQGIPQSAPQNSGQGIPQSAPQDVPRVVQKRIPRRSESAMPESVFLKEVICGQVGPAQILATTAAMYSKQMEMEALLDGSHCLRFFGQVWGPLMGLSLLKAKRVLAEAAVDDLRRELWTLRIRQMPDFSALQDVVGVQKETAVQASQELRRGDTPLDVGNVGHRMLRQMGWNAGKGLGKDGEGRKVPVSTDMTLIKRQGLGLKIGNSTNTAAFRQFIVQQLREFYDAGVNAEDLCFSSDFNNAERAVIHQTCRKYPDLESRSFNTADGNRFLVVMRKRSPKELLDWVIAKGCSTIRYEAFPPGLHPQLSQR